MNTLRINEPVTMWYSIDILTDSHTYRQRNRPKRIELGARKDHYERASGLQISLSLSHAGPGKASVLLPWLFS